MLKLKIDKKKRDGIIQRLVDNGWRKLKCHTTMGMVRYIKKNRFICTIDITGNYELIGIRKVKGG